MSFIYMIIMGLIVGVIARAIKPGADGRQWVGFLPLYWVLSVR